MQVVELELRKQQEEKAKTFPSSSWRSSRFQQHFKDELDRNYIEKGTNAIPN